MLKRMMLLILGCFLLNGCSALPAEDRSFAVALGISDKAGVWEASARVPSYQQGGGYLTLSAQGDSFQEAMALLDASAPMRMHYGQVRLLVIGRDLASSADFPVVLENLAAWPDMRLQAQVVVTEDQLREFMDALEPQTGARLSKSLDILLETRRELGVLPEASLSSVLRMGERQCPVLLCAALEKEESLRSGGLDTPAGNQAVTGAGKLQLGGGWLLGQEGQVKGSFSAAEMQLLSLLQGRLRQAIMPVGEGTVTLADAASRVSLDGNTARCTLTLRYTASTLSEPGMIRALQEDLRAVTDKLAAAGCDALGLGGYAIRHCADLPAWTRLNWPQLYPQLMWDITIKLHPAA